MYFVSGSSVRKGMEFGQQFFDNSERYRNHLTSEVLQ